MSLLSKLEASLTEKGALIADRDRVKLDLESAKAAHADLFTRLSASEAFASGLQAKVSDLESKLTESAKQLAEASAKADADVLAANQAKDAAEAKAKELTENPSAVALEIAAKAGVKPTERPKVSADSSQKTMSREDFSKLPASAQMEFARSGGRLI